MLSINELRFDELKDGSRHPAAPVFTCTPVCQVGRVITVRRERHGPPQPTLPTALRAWYECHAAHRPKGLQRFVAGALCGLTQPVTGFPRWTREFDSRRRLVEAQDVAEKRRRILARGGSALLVGFRALLALYLTRRPGTSFFDWLMWAIVAWNSVDVGVNVYKYLRVGRQSS